MAARRRIYVAVLGVLLLLVTACTSKSKDTVDRTDAKSVAEGFGEAMSAKTASGAATLTNESKAATKLLGTVFKDLPAKKVAFTLGDFSSGESAATAMYHVTWDFGKERVWKYNVSADLERNADGQWSVSWGPGVVHPSLTPGTSLAFAEVSPPGPKITDRSGQDLLTEQTVNVVRVDPTQVTDQTGTATALANLLNQLDPSITAESIAAQLAASPAAVVTIVVLRSADAAKVTFDLGQIAGVSIVLQNRLLTSEPSLSSPVFTDLKKVWDTTLEKNKGWRVTLKDAQGKAASVLTEGGLDGLPDIQTTIDPVLQSAAQAAIAGYSQQAAIVAVQPSTGAVLAVAQNAAADAEGPIALTGLYPPGSTFKVVSTTAIMANGIATADSIQPCPGTANIQGRQIPNDDQFDLGNVPLHTAFAQSCNTTIAPLSLKLPSDALHNTALSCGLGIDYDTPGLTTLTGKVPVTTTPAEQVESSIGQGSVVASPFGMALCASAVVTGQVPTPVLINGQPATPDQTPKALPADVLANLRSMMSEVVTSGTAKQLADITGLGGKTGTAQFGDGTHSHGWFIGTYKDLAFAVLVVGADSSKPAVTAAGEFLRPVAGTLPG